jgi:hypothetical protein
VELRGFEPLTSAVPSAARLTSRQPPVHRRLVGDVGAQLEPSLGQRRLQRTAPLERLNVSPVSTRIAWLPVAASKRRAITAT